MGKKPGIYAHITPTLPKFTPDDKKLEKVSKTVALVQDEFKERGAVFTAEALAREFTTLRKKKDFLKRVLSDVEVRLAAVQSLVEKYFEVEGISSLKLSDKAGVRLQTEVYSKILDKEAFRVWCVKNGFEKDLRLWPSTTQAMIRERLLNGLAAPTGTEATAKTKAVYMKGEMPVIDDSWLDDYAEEFSEEMEDSDS